MAAGPRFALLASALCFVGCYADDEGVEPPLKSIYFPTGIALSAGATRMYVANSDFDLQYNGGSLQALDLTRIRSLVPRHCEADDDCSPDQHCDLAPSDANQGFPSSWCVATAGEHAGEPCGPFGEKDDAAALLEPGRCAYASLTRPQDGGPSLVLDAVGIGAFATDILYRPRPNGPGGRLFVPVRGDATLHFIDVVDEMEGSVPFELDCGQDGNGGDCDDDHRRGDDPDEENTRGLRLLPEPFGLAATPDGSAMVLTHQTEGSASLFVNDDGAWGDGQVDWGSGPNLEFAVGGMPARPIGVVPVPPPAYVADAGLEYAPGFLVTFRDSPQIALLRYHSDDGSVASQPPRPFLQVAGGVGITINSVGFDSRGIAVEDSERKACEAACPTAPGQPRTDCLETCAPVPVQVYVANRTPSTLLVGETRPAASPAQSDDLPRFYESIPLPFGPSKVVIGDVVNPQGQREQRVFVICFDSRKIGIYDPKARRIEKWIETGRGPHAFALDIEGDGTSAPEYAYAYVGHFTDSYVGVVDLDQRHPTYGTILLTVGRPSAPRASK